MNYMGGNKRRVFDIKKKDSKHNIQRRANESLKKENLSEDLNKNLSQIGIDLSKLKKLKESQPYVSFLLKNKFLEKNCMNEDKSILNDTNTRFETDKEFDNPKNSNSIFSSKIDSNSYFSPKYEDEKEIWRDRSPIQYSITNQLLRSELPQIGEKSVDTKEFNIDSFSGKYYSRKIKEYMNNQKNFELPKTPKNSPVNTLFSTDSSANYLILPDETAFNGANLITSSNPKPSELNQISEFDFDSQFNI